jgi:hypothetical protein
VLVGDQPVRAVEAIGDLDQRVTRRRAAAAEGDRRDRGGAPGDERPER